MLRRRVVGCGYRVCGVTSVGVRARGVRVRGVCERRAGRISSGVFIPAPDQYRWRSVGGSTAARRRRVPTSRPSLWDAVEPNGRRVDVAFGVRGRSLSCVQYYHCAIALVSLFIQGAPHFMMTHIPDWIRFGESDARTISLSEKLISLYLILV